MTKKRHPVKCPKCGAKSFAEILWGMPVWSKQMARDEKAGKIFLGGCCVTDDDPEWHCNKCEHEWGHTHPEYEGEEIPKRNRKAPKKSR